MSELLIFILCIDLSDHTSKSKCEGSSAHWICTLGTDPFNTGMCLQPGTINKKKLSPKYALIEITHTLNTRRVGMYIIMQISRTKMSCAIKIPVEDFQLQVMYF